MYLEFFHLSEPPFSITPDPAFLYLGERHQEALAHLQYSLQGASGFVLLTGEVGTGKTTLCRHLVGLFSREVDLAVILNPALNTLQLVSAICDDLAIARPQGADIKTLTDLLNQRLLANHHEGRRTLLIIDEAQNLSEEVLEQIRLLTNLETTKEKLLQIILVGQPELRQLIGRHQLRQLAQRITARYHILPLSLLETMSYILHRLDVAGCPDPLFTRRAMKIIHRHSGGIPRVINKICDRALLGAFARGSRVIDATLARQAAEEILDLPPSALVRFSRPLIWTGSGLLAAVFAAWAWQAAPPLADFRAVPVAPAPPAAPPEKVAAPEDAALTESAAALPPAPPSAPVEEPAPPLAPESVPTQPTVATATPPPATEEGVQALFEIFEAGKPIPREEGFVRLYGLWKVAPSGGKPGCDQARGVGLNCLEQSGNWTMLASLDLPALITLSGPGNLRLTAVLSRLQGETATLLFPDREITVRTSQVDPFWNGQFLVLWRPPALRGGALRLQSKGEDVAWLRRTLDAIEGRDSPAGGDETLFDWSLAQRVSRFQYQNGLPPDGVVGPLTQLRLVHALQPEDPSRPHLK